MASKRHPTVPRDFDDRYAALVAFVEEKGVTVSGIALEQLQADVLAQRSQTQQDHEMSRQADAFHDAFLAAQAERYGRYMQALNILRQVYRSDTNVQRELAHFKPRRRRSGQSTPGSQEQVA